jgi:dUTP pyrophosphatase
MNDQSITLMPGDRVMVPTGLILDIPDGYSVRVHARSGLSLKQGLILVNSEGVIDSDYVEELFVLLTNVSENAQVIKNGDRIAQAELVKKEEYALWEIFEAPAKKTDRDGGMGSTGTKGIIVEAVKPVQIPSVTVVEEPVKRGRGRPKKVLTTG